MPPLNSPIIELDVMLLAILAVIEFASLGALAQAHPISIVQPILLPHHSRQINPCDVFSTCT
jgi:hypothetical protein